MNQEVIDICSFGVVICTIFELLPPIAAALSIIWLLIRIGEWAYSKYKLSKERAGD